MKTRILITGLALASTVAFGQKKEIKKAERALKSNKYTEAINYLNEAEGMLGDADNDLKAKFYAAKGDALSGTAGQNADKLIGAAESYGQAIAIDPSIKSQIDESVHTLRASLINGAVREQRTGKHEVAANLLYASYNLVKDPSDLYFTAGSYMTAQKYDKALAHYQTLLDMGYTGETQEFVATNKATGEVVVFENENLRNISLRTGEYIKPEVRMTDSRIGDILQNMIFIYLNRNENDKASELIRKARAADPNNVNIMRAEADLSVRTGDYGKFEKIMLEMIATDPENPELYTNAGIANAEIGNKEKAIDFYEQALKFDPNYEAALINISVVKLSYQQDFIDEINGLGTSRADNARYDVLRDKLNDINRDAMPYLEKAYSINPDTKGVAQTLMNIYGQLGEDAKFEQMKAKVQELENKN